MKKYVLVSYVSRDTFSPLKHTCSWLDKLIVLWILSRQAKIFLRTLNPICAYGSDIETPCNYLIYCPIFDGKRNNLLNNIRQITPSILNFNHSQIIHVLLYGDSCLKNEINTEILKSSMNYILSTKKLEGSIL